MRLARILVIVAAICGNAVHVYLGALTVVGGWPSFEAGFLREFESTLTGFDFAASVIAKIIWMLMIYVVWFGAPLYLLSVAGFITPSVPVTLVTAISIGGLIALDKDGNIAMPFNTAGMYRGYIKDSKEIGRAHV